LLTSSPSKKEQNVSQYNRYRFTYLHNSFGIPAGTEDVAAVPVWLQLKFGILLYFDTPFFPLVWYLWADPQRSSRDHLSAATSST